MNKRVMIAISAVAIIMIIIFTIKGRKKTIQENLETKNIEASDIILDENTGEYVVYNKDTGEEIARSIDEGSLYIYTIDPDYDPKIDSDNELLEE